MKHWAANNHSHNAPHPAILTAAMSISQVGVGLDGSDVVKKAMKTLKRLVNTDRGDSLSGLHIEDPVKHEFQPTLRPDFLHRQFDRAVYPIPAVCAPHQHAAVALPICCMQWLVP